MTQGSIKSKKLNCIECQKPISNKGTVVATPAKGAPLEFASNTEAGGHSSISRERVRQLLHSNRPTKNGVYFSQKTNTTCWKCVQYLKVEMAKALLEEKNKYCGEPGCDNERGSNYYCKECNTKRCGAWVKNNRQRANATAKRWRDENPEKFKETQRRWRENHPEQYREVCRQAYQKRKARELEQAAG